ncbi:MAG: S-layer homology domain-containing protein [Clostridia bacterium]|nr:S-layer homology domain-containing protein [Clostridia bacterium]
MKKRFTLAITLILSAVAITLAIGVIFAGSAYIPPCDIDDCYAKDEINYVCLHGIIDLYSSDGENTFFMPEKAITRAEFAKILTALLKINVGRVSSRAPELADKHEIPEEYQAYVQAACAEGIMGLRKEDDKLFFAPNEFVSRQEAAYVLGNLIPAYVSTLKTEKFSDFEETNEIYMTNASTLVALDMMIGYDDGTFRPQNDITRQELALVLYRMIHSGEKLKY